MADEKNIFVGMGGIRDHPGLPAISSDYHRGFADNNVGVFTVVTTPLGTVWSVVGSKIEFGSVRGTNGVSFGGYPGFVSSFGRGGACRIRS